MSDFDPSGERFWSPRRSFLVISGLLLLAAGGVWWKKHVHFSTVAPRPERVVTVSLPPPPRPVPTPPPVQPPEQKVVENKPTMEDAPKPDAPKPEPPKLDEPPPSLGSNIKGDGKDGFGLSGSGNGGRVGFGGNGRGSGNGFGAFASHVQVLLADSHRQDPKTRTSTFDLKIRVWVDASGTVTRVDPGGASAVARFVGIRLAQRPPPGMPMPITLRLIAKRPQGALSQN